MQQREFVDVLRYALRESHDNRENHSGGADNCRTNQHRFCRGFKRVSRTVVGFEQILGALKVHVHVVIFFQLLLDVRNGFNLRELVHRLRVVGNWTIRIYGDGDGTHAEETKRYQAKSENRSRDHQVAQALQTD